MVTEPRDREPSAAPQLPPMAVVRRGHPEVFRILEETLASQPVQVMWDRRVADRRRSGAARRQHPAGAGDDRRRGDRRSPPPLAWETLHFVFVRQPDGPQA